MVYTLVKTLSGGSVITANTGTHSTRGRDGGGGGGGGSGGGGGGGGSGAIVSTRQGNTVYKPACPFRAPAVLKVSKRRD